MNPGIIPFHRDIVKPMPRGLLGWPTPIPTPANTSFHPDAVDWARRAAANNGIIPFNTLRAVSDFCYSINRSGLRSKFYRLNLFVGSNIQAALTPLYIGPNLLGSIYGPLYDTNFNFVSSDFSETLGFQTNGNAQKRIEAFPTANVGIPDISYGHMTTHITSYTTGTGFAHYLVGPNDFAFINGANGSSRGAWGTGAPGGEQYNFRSVALRYHHIRNGPLVINRSVYIGRYAQGPNTTATSVASATTNTTPLVLMGSNNRGGTNATLSLGMYSVGEWFDQSMVTNYEIAILPFCKAIGRPQGSYETV